MKVLVTGASGFVGRALLTRLPAEFEVVGVVRRTPDWGGALTTVDWVELDLTEPRFQHRLPIDVDAIVHLAQSRYDRSFPDRADDVVDVNVAATARLLDHARTLGAKRFVLASTATVYRHDTDALDEDAPLDLSSFYAASKRAAELLACAYSSEVPTTVMRIFTTYGAGQRGRLVAELVERITGGKPVTVQGRRGLVLSPIHVNDVADALLAACVPGGPDFEILNVGGPEPLGIAEIADQIGRALGRQPTIERDGEGEPGGLVANTERLVRRFPQLQRAPFTEGLRRTLEPHRLS